MAANMAKNVQQFQYLNFWSVSLRLDNEAIRLADGLRLGVKTCESHEFRCNKLADSRGFRGLCCTKAQLGNNGIHILKT